MSGIWLNSELSRIETGNRLFNAYQSRELPSIIGVREVATGSEKKRVNDGRKENWMGEFLFHLRKHLILAQILLTDNITFRIISMYQQQLQKYWPCFKRVGDWVLVKTVDKRV